jgi:hypothetical protein
VAHGGDAEFGVVGCVASEWRVGTDVGDRLTLAAEDHPRFQKGLFVTSHRAGASCTSAMLPPELRSPVVGLSGSTFVARDELI